MTRTQIRRLRRALVASQMIGATAAIVTCLDIRDEHGIAATFVLSYGMGVFTCLTFYVTACRIYKLRWRRVSRRRMEITRRMSGRI